MDSDDDGGGNGGGGSDDGGLPPTIGRRYKQRLPCTAFQKKILLWCADE